MSGLGAFRHLWPGVPLALGSALLFGLTAPLSKKLLGAFDPQLLAGVLYLGAGLGLMAACDIFFAAEEAVMTDLDYPLRGQHFDRHRELQQSVGNLMAEARVKGATPACQCEIARFLNDWIVHHIRESDREMAQFLRTQPIDLEALILPDIRTLKLCGAIPIDFDDKFAAGTAGMRQR